MSAINSSTTGNGISTSVLDEHLSLISITIGTFGGYRRATRDAISKLGGSLPSCKAITEGSLKVFPGEPLAVFHTIRRSLFRAMSKRGIRALGSSNVFAIPRKELDDVEKEIAEAGKEFSQARDDLEANYDDLFEKHVAQNTEAEEIIRHGKFDCADAISRLHFSSAMFRIQPEVREGQDAEQGVQGIVQGLGRQLFEEVSDDMSKLLDNDAFKKHQRCGQKTLRPLQAVIRKMTGLSFLDERSIKGVIQMVEDVLSSLPKQGYIEDKGVDRPFSKLRRLVEVMSDADDLVNAAGKISNGLSADEVLFPPKPVPQKPVVQEVMAQSTSDPVVNQPAATAQQSVLMPALPPLPGMSMPVIPMPSPVRAAIPMF